MAPATAVADSPELQEIVVTATLRSMPATEVPASVTVLSEQTCATRAAPKSRTCSA